VLPYWILFSVFAAGALEARGHAGQRAATRPLLVIAVIGMALMIGLRYRVGGDWESYTELYQRISYSQFADALFLGDPGYTALNWIGSSLGLGIWFVNLVCAAIFCWGLIRFARSQPNPWLVGLIAVPYLVIVVAMGYTRQAVAIGLIMAALPLVGRSSLVRIAVYVVIAATFHKSAAIVLPLVALTSPRNRFMTGAILLFTGALIYYLFLRDSVDQLMVNYVEAEYQSEGAGIRVALNIPPAILYLLFWRRMGLPEEQRRLWRNFSYAAFVALAFLMLTASSTAVDRVSLFLIPLQLFMLARLPAAVSRGGQDRLVKVAVIGYAAIIQFVWLNYATHAVYWLPYKFYPFSGV
jgi:hypothetical protein